MTNMRVLVTGATGGASHQLEAVWIHPAAVGPVSGSAGCPI